MLWPHSNKVHFEFKGYVSTNQVNYEGVKTVKFHYIIQKDRITESYGVANGKKELIRISELVKDENCTLKVLNRPDFLKIKRKIDMKTNRKRAKTFKIERIDYMNA
uniref:Uncharacterized protein n=1 Tax=Methanococcus maripaludis (strain C7 / ATCC BAA-1331) TaxID=426368 RepID=A6VF70_METM7